MKRPLFALLASRIQESEGSAACRGRNPLRVHDQLIHLGGHLDVFTLLECFLLFATVKGLMNFIPEVVWPKGVYDREQKLTVHRSLLADVGQILLDFCI